VWSLIWILTTSPGHEAKKSMIARLVEHFAFVRRIDLRAYGSTTFREEAVERGAEPDECYIVGRELGKAPDIAIEVVITHGGLDKLAIYQGLGVREVWFWIDGEISIHRLAGKRYRRATRSRFVPGLDPELLARYASRPDQLAALDEFDAAIRE
jgi:Uma2 family endonuclease